MANILLGGSSPSDVDERIAAKAALEAAEEQLQTLCKLQIVYRCAAVVSKQGRAVRFNDLLSVE